MSYIIDDKGLSSLLLELDLHAIKSSLSILPSLTQLSLVCRLQLCKLMISLEIGTVNETHLDLQAILGFLLAFVDLQFDRFDLLGMSRH